MGQTKTGAFVFISLLCCFAFESGNEIVDVRKSVVCIFIIYGHAHYFLQANITD